ncbi:serum response factor-binding protein 1 [Biomphalaria pfeifferi]|uniref:Serum response factor-binding protein 1 n=1 Tax=Biomphalaria pfeifferi TaxID=112525 RepID=A0AAD8FAN1_BIOPF|nr:serum response factor-binding protein 1 [Biomphalaria pfeifferi]
MENSRNLCMGGDKMKYRNNSCSHSNSVSCSVNCNNKNTRNRSSMEEPPLSSAVGTSISDVDLTSHHSSQCRHTHRSKSRCSSHSHCTTNRKAKSSLSKSSKAAHDSNVSESKGTSPICAHNSNCCVSGAVGTDRCPRPCRIILPAKRRPGLFYDLEKNGFFDCFGNLLLAAVAILFATSIFHYLVWDDVQEEHFTPRKPPQPKKEKPKPPPIPKPPPEAVPEPPPVAVPEPTPPRGHDEHHKEPENEILPAPEVRVIQETLEEEDSYEDDVAEAEVAPKPVVEEQEVAGDELEMEDIDKRLEDVQAGEPVPVEEPIIAEPIKEPPVAKPDYEPTYVAMPPDEPVVEPAVAAPEEVISDEPPVDHHHIHQVKENPQPNFHTRLEEIRRHKKKIKNFQRHVEKKGSKMRKEIENIPEEPKRERPNIERPNIERPHIERPNIESPNIERPHIERPHIERPNIERPNIERPHIERPNIERPNIERPNIERPNIERPKIEKTEQHTATTWSDCLFGFGSDFLPSVSWFKLLLFGDR